MTVVSQLWTTAVKNDKVAVSYSWAGNTVNIGGLYMRLLPPPWRRLCDQVGLSIILSDCVQDYCKDDQPISWKLSVMIGPTNRKNWLTFGSDPVADTDSGSLFDFPHLCGILDLLAFRMQSLAENACSGVSKDVDKRRCLTNKSLRRGK